jgi:cell shape-determining protein MreC
MVKKWEQQVQDGTLLKTSRGPKQKNRQTLTEENKQLRRKLERLEQRLERTEMIVELQKKLSSILDLSTNPYHEKPDGQ